MLLIHKKGFKTLIKSTYLHKINVRAQLLDVKTGRYGDTFLLATLDRNETAIPNLTTDGKYRLFVDNLTIRDRPELGVDNLIIYDYYYIEHYAVFHKTLIKQLKTFLCANADCCDLSGDDLKEGLAVLTNLLTYYNLSTNTSYTNNNICYGVVVDVFIRQMFDLHRLDFLYEANKSNKSLCIFNENLTLPLAKKIACIYFLALYWYEFYVQYSVSSEVVISPEDKADIDSAYDIDNIRRCIVRHGFEFEASKDIFYKTLPKKSLVNGVDKHYNLESNLETEVYSFTIKADDIYFLPQQDVLRSNIYMKILTLPIVGNLYYTDKFGVKFPINELTAVPFNLLSLESIIYEYPVLSDNQVDMFLYKLVEDVDACDEIMEYNRISVTINEYEYAQDINPLNMISVKLRESGSVYFAPYHIFKILKADLQIYEIKDIQLNVDSDYVIINNSGEPVTDFNFPTDYISGKVTLEAGAMLTEDPYKGEVVVTYKNDTKVNIPIIFKVFPEEVFDSVIPEFTINSLASIPNTVYIPFYETEYPIFVDSIGEHRNPLLFYFNEITENGTPTNTEPISGTTAILNKEFPGLSVVRITSSTDNKLLTRTFNVDNRAADVVIDWNSTDTNVLVNFATDNLGEGNIINAAWEPGVINSNNFHRYSNLINKKTYLEIYPHDSFKYNDARIVGINLSGTFNRINLSETSIGNTINNIVHQMDIRTPLDNVYNLPIGMASFPRYVIGKNINYVGREYPTQDLYDSLYNKGVLISLASEENTNPFPTNASDKDLIYPNHVNTITDIVQDGNVVRMKIVNTPSLLPTEEGQILADVLIYARLEIYNVIDNKWEIGSVEPYHNLKVNGEVDAFVPISRNYLDPNNVIKYRVASQGKTGTILSEEFLHTVNNGSISYIESYTFVGSTLEITLSELIPVGESSIEIYGDVNQEYFIESVKVVKNPEDLGKKYVSINLSRLTVPLIEKATFVIEYRGTDTSFLQTVIVDPIKTRASLIINPEGFGTISPTFRVNQVGSNGDFDLYMLLHPAYVGGYVDNPNYEITYSILSSVSNTNFNNYKNSNSHWINCSFKDFPGYSKVYLKALIIVKNLVGEVIDTIDTYTIAVELYNGLDTIEIEQ